jgi:WD40 repeat protein
VITGKSIYDPLKHAAVVNYATFNSTGDLIVTACDDMTARLWSVRTGTLFKELPGQIGGLAKAAFSTDSQYLVAEGRNEYDYSGMQVWEISTACPWLARDLTIPYGSVNFSPNGQYYVADTYDKTSVIAVEAQKKLLEFSLKDYRRADVLFAPNSHSVLTILTRRNPELWDIDDSKPEARLRAKLDHLKNTNTSKYSDSKVAFSPDSKLVAITNFGLMNKPVGLQNGYLTNGFQRK